MDDNNSSNNSERASQAENFEECLRHIENQPDSEKGDDSPDQQSLVSKNFNLFCENLSISLKFIAGRASGNDQRKGFGDR